MTKNYFNNIADKLDEEKFSLLGSGIAFQLVIYDKNTDGHRMIGIGDGGDMSLLVLIALRNLYEVAKQNNATAEEFIDSVKDGFLRFIESDFPFDGNIHVFGAEEGDEQWQE